MEKKIEIQEIVEMLNFSLQELTEMNDEKPFAEFGESHDDILNLIHKLLHHEALSENDAYSLTHYIPRDQRFEKIKENVVYPYISEVEVYRRDVLRGYYKSVVPNFEDIFNLKLK